MSRHRMRTRRQRRAPRYPVVFGRVLSSAGRREVEAFAAGLAREHAAHDAATDPPEPTAQPVAPDVRPVDPADG